MKKRAIQVLCLLLAIYENALYSGIVYGWASLVYIFKDAGYFSEGCSQFDGANSSAASANTTATYHIVAAQTTFTTSPHHLLLVPANQTTANTSLAWTTTATGPTQTLADRASPSLSPLATQTGGYQACDSQDRSLNLAFTIGAFTLAGSTLFIGIVVDRFGLRVIKLSGWAFTFAGLLCFTFSSPQLPQLIFPAMVACATGGCMLIVGNYQVGHLFKKMRSTVVAVTCGAFDASAFVFLAVKLCYDNGIATKTSFSVLAGSTVGILLFALLLLPKDNIPWPIPDGWWDHREGKSRASEASIEMNPKDSESERRTSLIKRNKRASKNRIRKQSMYKVSLHGGSTGKLSLKQCLLSTLFLSHLVWMSILQLRNWFFFITFNNWLSILADGDNATVSQYTNIFAFIQFGGILTAPLSGLIMDRNKHKEGNEHRGQYADLKDSVLALAATTTLSNLFSVTVLVPILEVQCASFVLQTVLKSFLYSINAAFLGLVFPSRYMGTMVGCSLTLASIFGLVEYPLFIVAQKYSNNDPFIVNVTLLVLSILTYSHAVYTHLYIKRRERRQQVQSGMITENTEVN